MRRFVYSFAMAAAIFVFSMCSNNSNIPVESNWSVEYICNNGIQIAPPAEHNATIAFLKDSKIAGETGCNRFFGDYVVHGEKIRFENVGSTRMMCPQMQFETAYLQIISDVASYDLSSGQLTLKDSAGNIIALLKKIGPSALEN